MKAVILAGGKGTRLGKLTKSMPKPMVPLVGKPILEYQVELCSKYGITEIIFIVNHLKQPILDYFGDGVNYNVHISYFEEKQPLGTVGGIKEIENQLTEDFLVLYGDVLMDMDLNALMDFHQKKNSEATLVVHPNDHPYDSDLVELSPDRKILDILPKPHPDKFWYHNMVNAAVYILSPKIFQYLIKGQKADFGKDIFPKVFDKLRMYGYNTSEYLKDMGTPDRLAQVESDIISGKVARRSFEQKQKAIYLDRDGVINPDKDLIHKPEDMELYPFTINAVKKINTSDYLAVIVTNQSVVARNLTTINGLGEIHKRMETYLGNAGAKLDALYFCPHHPDKGYPEENPVYKVECDCRKPKPGMLNEAAKDFNIDTKQSYLIGDSGTDIQAGKAAGCTTIGVRTGSGLKGSNSMPDYFFANLKEAVDFIVDEPYLKAYKEIKDIIGSSERKPFIIALGGNSRAGKSTLTTYLQKKLENDGNSVLTINLDNWILPKEKRQTEKDVYHNFQMPALEVDIEKLLNGQEISVHGYKPHKSWATNTVHYKIDSQNIIIIEGVVALASEKIRQYADLNIYKSIAQKDLKDRIYSFYKWKGYDNAGIDAIWRQRKTNEYDIIEKTVKWADMAI